MRTLISPVLALLALLLVTPGASAQDADGEVRLSLARYQQLMNAARGGAATPATWGRGEVTVRLPARSEGPEAAVEVSLRARVTVRGEGDPARVPLLPADAVLKEATVDGREVSFVAREGVLLASVPATGQPAEVRLRYLATVSDTGGGARGVVVPLPPLPGAALRVEGAEEPATVEVWPASAVRRGADAVTASVPAAHGLVLRWGAGRGAGLVRRVDLVVAPDDDGDGVDVEVTVEARVDGPRGLVPVAPPGAALVEVTEGGRPLRARVSERGHLAVVEGAGRHVVRARYRLPIDRSQGQPRVAFAMEPAPITRVVVTVPGKRDVTIAPQAPVTRTVQGEGDATRTTAEAHLPPTEQVEIRWTETLSAPEDLVRTNVETFQLVTLKEAVVRSRVVLRYEVIRGKIRELPIAIPQDAVLFRVRGEGIDDWRTFAAEGDEPRQARVYLADEVDGTYRLELEMEMAVATAEGAALDVPLVRPLGAYRERGVVALFDGEKVGFAPAEAPGYRDVGEDALPVEIRQGLTDKVGQAWEHVGPPGPIRSSVAAAPERVARFDARVHALHGVKEGAIVAGVSVLVEIKRGRRDHLLLDLPAEATVLSLHAPSLNEAEPAPDVDLGEGRRAHRVRFTRGLEGAVRIDLELELLLPRELGRVPLPRVGVVGAEVEEGAFGVTADTGIEVRAGEAEDVRRVDAAELPREVRLRTEREILLGYTYARAPWDLDLEIRRHRTVETLEAVARSARLRTTVLEDGHVVTHARWQVANDDRQYLRLVLPAGHEVWSVSVDGARVKAVADEQGALAVPLPRGREVRVDVVWQEKRERLGTAGRLDLAAPRADLLVTDVRWLVRTPTRLALFGVDSAMEEAPVWRFYADWEEAEGVGMPVSLPDGAEVRERLFTRAVHDPSEEALTVGASYVATPGPGMGLVLGLLALALLVPVVRRRARRESLGARGVAMLAAGLALVIVRAVGWGIDPVEGSVAVAVLAAAAIHAAWSARGRRVEA